MENLKTCTEQNGLIPEEWFLHKCVQLYETLVVRHGLMVVGPTGGGKSSNIRVLSDCLMRLYNKNIEGKLYAPVMHSVINPKTLTMAQLYGDFDPNTREFVDGVIPCLYRRLANNPSIDRKFLIFDGPVDTLWIESMNTVLDDNKKLCLTSGEMLQPVGFLQSTFSDC